MHKPIAMVALVAAALIPDAAFSQPAQRPDFSGTWSATTDPPAGLAAAPSPVFGARFSIRQSGDSLTLTRPLRETALAVTYALDGRETRTRVPAGVCQAEPETIETAAWERDALIFTVVGSVPAGGGPPSKLNVRRVFRLHAPDTLIVEATAGGTAQTPARQVGTVYRRSNDTLTAPPAPAAAASKAAATIADVAWIGGVWVGTAGTTTVEERWTPPAGGSMLGIGRTLRNTSMASFEFLCIAERDGGLVYLAMPNARTPATPFTLTAITADSATFENPQHDYPKVIRYTRKADSTLETYTAGDAKQKAVTVTLKRVAFPF